MPILRVRMMIAALCFGLCVLALPNAFTADSDMAKAMAIGAETLFKAGDKHEKAKKVCFTALAMDANCAEANLLMGEILESENKLASASNFYIRAMREFAKRSGDKDGEAKLSKVKKKVNMLDPHSANLSKIMEDYVQELDRVSSKIQDAITKEELYSRSQTIGLDKYIEADKMPDFAKAPTKPEEPKKSEVVAVNPGVPTSVRPLDARRQEAEKPVKTSVPPDVERELKAAGWEKITGVWKSLGKDKYEVTDGTIEAAKTDVLMQCVVHNGTGEVQVMAHSKNTNYGYGVVFKQAKGNVYMPGTGSLYYSTYTESYGSNHLRHVEKLPYEKNVCMIQNAGNKMEIFINGKRKGNENSEFTKEGPCVVRVIGTNIIELPKIKGK